MLFQSKLADFRASAKRFPTEFHSAGDMDVSELTLMPILFCCCFVYAFIIPLPYQWDKYNQTLGRTWQISGCLLLWTSARAQGRRGGALCQLGRSGGSFSSGRGAAASSPSSCRCSLLQGCMFPLKSSMMEPCSFVTSRQQNVYEFSARSH